MILTFKGLVDMAPYDQSKRLEFFTNLFFPEPVITEGDIEYRELPDEWTIISQDNSRSCQFEHTVLITDTGVEVLTSFYMEYENI